MYSKNMKLNADWNADVWGHIEISWLFIADFAILALKYCWKLFLNWGNWAFVSEEQFKKQETQIALPKNLTAIRKKTIEMLKRSYLVFFFPMDCNV